MARYFSTGLRDLMNQRVPVLQGATIGPAVTIAAVTGTPDNFTDSANGFVTAMFQVGDTIMVSGFLAAANNGIFTITSVAAGKIEISETTVTGEVAGPNVKIQCIAGGSMKDIFKDGVLKIYSGTQPASADAAATGTLLCTLTSSSGAFTPGSPTNGLRLGTSTSGVLGKLSGQVWSGVNSATGVAGWFRLYANAVDSGALSTTLPRIDGSVGTSGATLNLTSVNLTSGVTLTIDTVEITFPAV